MNKKYAAIIDGDIRALDSW